MVKREGTPPTDDDSKYFTVNYPYPLYVNMISKPERDAFALWIASCIGQEYLVSVYIKNSAPNMVIVEVEKSCPKDKINALLGLHKWSEFLRNPEPDQYDKESRVYYCRYKSGRQVQKNGWNRLDVWEDWFKDFDPLNCAFNVPYPKTSYCDVPLETQTEYALCRPLPNEVFPKPKPVPTHATVVGSAKYVNEKLNGEPIVSSIPAKPTKSWANAVTSALPRKAEVEWPRTHSTSSSGSGSEVSQPVPTSGNFNPTSLPPGIGPPPGLPAPVSQTSSEWDVASEAMSSSESTFWPTNAEVITNSLTAASLSDGQDPAAEDKDQYWAEQPKRPVDWGKPICPVHEAHCRVQLCEVMSKIDHDKKREAERQNGRASSEGGWTEAKTGGRGKGRQGRGRGGASRGSSSKDFIGGGRGRGGW
ncbi:hypothetical protein DFH11DRAFT_1690809 [Phellopilus nigrolimitatus]|nr:hypothetical protein DFH11DRAFT_1690809 [Phellopilus nigrolimitatus]